MLFAAGLTNPLPIPQGHNLRGPSIALAFGKNLEDAFQLGRQAVKLSPSVSNASVEKDKFLLLPEGVDHKVPIFFRSATKRRHFSQLPSDRLSLPPLPILPMPPRLLVGREVEMYRVLLALRNYRVVYLTGQPGIGKRSMAAAICSYIRERSRRFPVDSIVWLPSLHSSSDDDTSATLVSLFNMIVNNGSEDEKKSKYRKAMGSLLVRIQKSRILIVVEGVGVYEDESNIGLREFLSDLIGGTKYLNVLLLCQTSARFQLCRISEESEISLKPLNCHDSLMLFGHTCPLVPDHTTRHLVNTIVPVGQEQLRPGSKSLSEANALILRAIGEGVPARVLAAAKEISPRQMAVLKRLGDPGAISGNEGNAGGDGRGQLGKISSISTLDKQEIQSLERKIDHKLAEDVSDAHLMPDSKTPKGEFLFFSGISYSIRLLFFGVLLPALILICWWQHLVRPRPRVYPLDETHYFSATGGRLPMSHLPVSLELIGRESTMVELERILEPSGRMAVITGGAGYGKSHCAKAYARDWYEKKSNRWGWWLLAETEIKLRGDYMDLLAALGLGLANEAGFSTGQIARLVWERLSANSFEWLLVFDNVPESSLGSSGPDAFKEVFFPNPLEHWSRGRILFTSRSSGFGGSLFLGRIEEVRVGTLQEPAAISMLLSNVSSVEYDDKDAIIRDAKEDNEAARFLVKQVNCLPLAIATISGHISDQGTTLHEYLKEFRLEEHVETDIAPFLDAARSTGICTKSGVGRDLRFCCFLMPRKHYLGTLGR